MVWELSELTVFGLEAGGLGQVIFGNSGFDLSRQTPSPCLTWIDECSPGLTMASLNVELRERTRQRGIHGCNLFGREFFFQASCGALTRFLSHSFVDVLDGDSHVGHDGDMIVRYLN